MSRTASLFLRTLLLALGCEALIAAEEPVSFAKDIAPILQAKCIGCHGSEKAKGGFRAHTYASFMTAGKSKTSSITPGMPETSEVINRITSDDPDERMPQKDDALPPAQIEQFRRWIKEGAKLDKGEPSDALARLIPRQPHAIPPYKYSRALPVLALAFNSAGTELLSGGYHELLGWDPSGKLLRRITNVVERVYAVSFDNEGKTIAVAGGQPGRNGELTLYNAATGQAETNLLETPDVLLCLTFDPKGKWLAAGGSDNGIHIFDYPGRREITNIQQHADWVTALSFNSDGSKVASASRDRSARVYDPATGNLETTYAEHEAALSAVVFVNNDELASGGKEMHIDLWNRNEGHRLRRIKNFSGEIFTLLATPELIFSAAADKLVRAHDPKTGKLIRTFEGQNEAVYALALNRSSGRLAAGGYDGRVTIWNIADGKLLASFVAAPGLQDRR